MSAKHHTNIADIMSTQDYPDKISRMSTQHHCIIITLAKSYADEAFHKQSIMLTKYYARKNNIMPT